MKTLSTHMYKVRFFKTLGILLICNIMFAGCAEKTPKRNHGNFAKVDKTKYLADRDMADAPISETEPTADEAMLPATSGPADIAPLGPGAPFGPLGVGGVPGPGLVSDFGPVGIPQYPFGPFPYPVIGPDGIPFIPVPPIVPFDEDDDHDRPRHRELRGTVDITGFTQAEDGAPITAVTAEPSEGEGFSVSSTDVIDPANIAQLISTIVGGNPGAALVVRPFQVEINVEFDKPFEDVPSVVATLHDSAGALGNTTALVESFVIIVKDITTTGFTVDIFMVTFGLTASDVYELLAFFLSDENDPGFSFIATDKN